MSTSLAPERLESLRQQFLAHDSNQDGSLSQTECTELVANITGRSTGDYAVQCVIRLFDEDGNGVLDFEEFASLVSCIENGYFDREVTLEDAFRMADKDRNGVLTHKELRHLLKTNPEFSKEDIKRIMDQVETNPSGQITYEIFAKLIEELEPLAESEQ
ncbi:uncharacterized protein BJ171DRAFT_477635 [Polychytrium aggregatum]|uniref:uncharacterized protein n=1 Tax=Polychytrium aggregatum TaxID=110093 RepID=UPI0022FDFCA3|nr:uncharacterized protein BJ171DRAFT_477635 [Polychytrium aggregatum]KAI9199326.1 hypothetical protein BJ171DRAFT_477635 [Polychytrium aggregatum]